MRGFQKISFGSLENAEGLFQVLLLFRVQRRALQYSGVRTRNRHLRTILVGCLSNSTLFLTCEVLSFELGSNTQISNEFEDSLRRFVVNEVRLQFFM